MEDIGKVVKGTNCRSDIFHFLENQAVEVYLHGLKKTLAIDNFEELIHCVSHFGLAESDYQPVKHPLINATGSHSSRGMTFWTFFFLMVLDGPFDDDKDVYNGLTAEICGVDKDGFVFLFHFLQSFIFCLPNSLNVLIDRNTFFLFLSLTLTFFNFKILDE